MTKTDSKSMKSAAEPSFQERVAPWMDATFGAEISANVMERNSRFLEEAIELVQARGCTVSEAHQLVDYVFNRPAGEPAQEVGGVMVTLAALCLAASIDMHEAGETELARIWTEVEQIRAKQAAKPKHAPPPECRVTASIPAGMKPWLGGDQAPEDWDPQSPVMTATGSQLVYREGWLSFDWKHHEEGFRARGNIIAYTPTHAEQNEEPLAEVERLKQQGARLTIAYHVAICSPEGVIPDDEFYDPTMAAGVQRLMAAGIPLKATLRSDRGQCAEGE